MSHNIFVQYLEWHFFNIAREILEAWRNCLRFNLNHWSVPLLLKTWFSPWRRYRYSYGKGFSFTKYFEVFSFNMTSRVIGAIMRTFLIAAGFVMEALVFCLGLLAFLVWLVLPVLLIFGFVYGCKLLF